MNVTLRFVPPTLGFILLSLAACNDGVDQRQATDAAPNDAADAASDAAPRFVGFKVKLVDATSRDKRLAGIDVCAADRPDIACARSGADGAIAMQLPVDSELMLRCAGSDYGPAYMTWTTGREDVDAGTFGLLTKDSTAAFITLAGGTPSAEKGAITVNVFEDLVRRDARVAGASFTIVPAGGGPSYVGTSGIPESSLEATTAAGPGLFYDLAPGEVTITIKHPTRKCTGGFGWKTTNPAALRGRVFGGGLSNVTFVCPP